ncbi:class II glutamine amidotransferase [Pseudaestuariivita sp.]|uniref:class II glutamine amidotransferase n=1 Tax=Pseudaestuariivita sp. TaxID=2211669 RepID=UPI004057EAD4
MCRLLAYRGPAIPLERLLVTPAHSLVRQSQYAAEAKLAVNGDGFGMAWYAPGCAEPAVYRDTHPAWSDENLRSLARAVRTEVCLAHVRAATFGATARTNCHPFTFGAWSFAHNGQLADFAERRRAYEALVPDALYVHRRGSTDSEVLFLLLLANGLKTDPERATQRTLAQIAKVGDGARRPTRIAWVLSNGQDVWALRWSSDGRAPSLYRSDAPLDSGGAAFSSEPLDGAVERWTRLPEGALVSLTRETQPA